MRLRISGMSLAATAATLDGRQGLDRPRRRKRAPFALAASQAEALLIMASVVS